MIDILHNKKCHRGGLLYIWRWLILPCFAVFFTGTVAHPLFDNAVAGSPVENVTEFRLPYGLRVILAADDIVQESRRQNGVILSQLLMQALNCGSMQSLAECEAALSSATLEEVNAAIRPYQGPASLVEVLAARATAVQQQELHD